MTIAFIGLGKLGLPIAARIAAAGHPIVGFDVSEERRALAAGRGLSVAEGWQAATADASTVFFSLPDDRVLLSLLGADGSMLGGIGPDTTVVETSTVSPEASARVAEALGPRRIGYLRAPVSGNPVLVEAGGATSFVSGPRALFDSVAAPMASYARSSMWLGEGEEARFAKLAVNLMIAVSAGMMAEAITLGLKGGLARNDLLDLMARSAVGSPMVQYKAPPLKDEDYSSTFSCRQMAKDIDLILAAAGSVGVDLPHTDLMRRTYADMIGTGLGEEDFIATVRFAEGQAGLKPARTGDPPAG